jgi:uncharacterized OsmC-like protein/alpha/beta superfamily hydrolase
LQFHLTGTFRGVTVHVRRTTFEGASGHVLAGRLDVPAGPPAAYALFAHCFTCSRDIHAASRIAAELADLGLGVLRFDFTGLGASEGEFANTDFTSNVGDLVAAAAWLREHHRAPQLLVGHSLGGAAVLVAAQHVPEVRAVATIGAPSGTDHLAARLAGSMSTVTDDGVAHVELAGRTFALRRELVDDLVSHEVPAAAAALHRALLILHSPTDNEVGVEHAARLFVSARHPKSFIALDGADHLLTDRADAAFAARVISTWAARYIVDESGAAPPPSPTAQVVVAETTQGRFLNHVVTGGHRFLTDEPVSVGGFDAGPTPYDLIGAALGACTSMTLRMYAERKRMDLDRVVVEVTHDRVHADDAPAAAGDADARIDRFRRVLHLDGDLDDEERARLAEIAAKCPVHRTLERSSHIETELAPHDV